jgi:hypothetical protein
MTKLAVALAALAFAPLAAHLSAQAQTRTLPEFVVVSERGERVPGGTLSMEDRWLLLYVSPDCVSCDRLLSGLAEWQIPQLGARTVVVIGGDLAAARAYADRSGTASLAVTWYADPERTAGATLGLSSSPALIGIAGGRIEWTLMGVLNDPGAVEPVIRRWVQ